MTPDRLYLNISVDTETPQTSMLSRGFKAPLFDADLDGAAWGLPKIVDILGEYKIKATFYINVYEQAAWGAECMSGVFETVLSNGHEAGLHTHPCWMYDVNREHMWQYSLDEQRTILARGMELFAGHASEAPRTHRAGAYGINLDTLQSLRELGIESDFSIFHTHRNCKARLTVNRPILEQGLLLLPITVFEDARNRPGKLDIEKTPVQAVRELLQKARGSGLNFISLMFHSYSLLSKYWAYPDTGPSEQMAERLRETLGLLKADSGIRIVTTADILDNMVIKDAVLSGANRVPTIDWSKGFMEQALEYSKKSGLIRQRLTKRYRGNRSIAPSNS